MRIYSVPFGIFFIYAAVVNSMWVPETGAVESLTRSKRADEKLEHEQTIIDSGATMRSDIETKSIKHDKDPPMKQEKEHHLKPTTPSKLHESLKTTTLTTPISTKTTTITPEPTKSAHPPIQQNPLHASKKTVETVQQNPQVPQKTYQIVPSAVVHGDSWPPLPMPVHSAQNPEQFAPMYEPQQNSFAYRESSIPHARSAYEEYNLGSTYQAAANYHQLSQSPCGSSVLISCQPSVEQSPCSSYQPSYHVAAPSYHVGIPSYHPQLNYHPQSLPSLSYREAGQNEMLAEDPLLGSSHHHHHHHRHHHHKTTTQEPEKQEFDSKKHTETKAQTSNTEPMIKTEENNSGKPDIVKHLKVHVKKNRKSGKDDEMDQNKTEGVDTNVGLPLVTMDRSTTEELSQEMRRMQSADISTQNPMQIDEMASSMMQSGQKMPPQISSNQMSVTQRDQQAEPSQIPSNQMPSTSGQQMPPQMLSDQMERQKINILQMHPDQMQDQTIIPQQMMPMNPSTLQHQQMEFNRIQPNQMQDQQMMPMNPLTLDPMLINPVNMRPVHEFHGSSSDGPILSMMNPMMENLASQSAGGSPQQLFWEPNGLYYRLI